MNFVMPTFIWECIRVDARRYGNGYFTASGFWVVFSYRVRRLRKYGPMYCRFLLPFDVLFGLIKSVLSDVTLPSCVAIGAGLYLPHPHGIFINHRVKIGSYVSIFQDVTIGEWHDAAPSIGDHSALFAGAKVFGGISVGKNCKLGANVVVNIDIPDDTSASVRPSLLRFRGE
jgi:serine O-acetyltransferase